MTQETLEPLSQITAATPAQSRTTQAQPSAKDRLRSKLLPSPEGVLFSLVFLGVILSEQGRMLGTDGDTALRLRLGNDMLQHGSLVTTNTLTSTAYGQPFIAWEWLSDLMFAGVWRLFGLNGVVVLVGLVISLTSVLLFRAVQKRGTPLLLALPLTLAAITLTSIHWFARPDIFSLLLTLWWSEQLWAYWQSGNPRKLWPLPFVLAVWANLHGGYVTGLILLGTAMALAWLFPNAASTSNIQARRGQLTRAFVACLLATLLTPWGLAGPAHLASFLIPRATWGSIQEDSSPDFHQPYGLLFLSLLLLLGACGVLRGWLAGGRAPHPADMETSDKPEPLAQLAVREPGALGWALIGIFTAMALIWVRSLPLWAVVVTPILGRELTCWAAEWAVADRNGRLARFCRTLFHRSWKAAAFSKPLRSWVLIAMTGAFVLALLLNGGALPGTSSPLLHAEFSPEVFPVEAVEAIQHGTIPGSTLPQGTGFTPMTWAGYIEFTLPHYPLMMDSRLDFFDEQVLHDYQTLLNGGPGWNQVIKNYKIRWLLIPPNVSLAQIISQTPGWTCQEADPHHMALLCVPAPSLPVA